MATITKRNGKYHVQIRRKGFAPACRTFRNRADADEWGRFMDTKADRGDLPTPIKALDAHKVREIIERYRDEITVKKLSAETETYMLNAFLRHPIANLTLAQITPAHFSNYRDKRLKEVKPGTVNRELSIIKHAFDIAGREWDIPLRENPLAKMKKLKAENARTRRMSDDEFKALQEAATKSRNKQIMPLVRFAVATGMRRGEIMRLRWDEIDFTARTLHIPVTKNGHARTIPLSYEATFPAFIAVWVLRIMSRNIVTNFNHKHDARNRAVMTETFLALMSEGKTTDNDRILILNALFQPVNAHSTEDGSPPHWFELLMERAKHKS